MANSFSPNYLNNIFQQSVVQGPTGPTSAIDLIGIRNINSSGTGSFSSLSGSLNININSLMLATGDSNFIMKSDDYGQTWETLTTSSNYTLNICTSIKWNGKIFVAIGRGVNTDILTSTDGKTWIETNAKFTGLGSDVEWNGEMWVAVGFGNISILTSMDGNTWTRAPAIPYCTAMYGVAYFNGRWVATGTDNGYFGVNLYSDDGKTWIATSGVNFGYSGNGVVAGLINGKTTWVAVGQQIGSGGGTNTIMYSLDNGVTWLFSTGTKFDVTGTSVAYHDGLFIAVGQNTNKENSILYSNDGIVWKQTIGSSFTDYGDNITWNGKRWVAVGRNTTAPHLVLLSNDGENWYDSGGEGLTVLTNNSLGIGTNNVWEDVPSNMDDAITKLSNAVRRMLHGQLV